MLPQRLNWQRLRARQSKLISEDRLAQTLCCVSAPDKELPTTDGKTVNLAKSTGRSVVYVYPRTSPPNGKPIEGWDQIPGARGCTPQSCSFRDHFEELKRVGADNVYGLSTQDSDYQAELVERLHLPFSVISDTELIMKSDLMLPTFIAGGMELYKRMTLVIGDGKVQKVFFPIDEPTNNAKDVIDYLKSNSQKD